MVVTYTQMHRSRQMSECHDEATVTSNEVYHIHECAIGTSAVVLMNCQESFLLYL